MIVIQQLLALLLALAAVSASDVKSDQTTRTDGSAVAPLGSLASLQGYPGALSRESVEQAVSLEVRNQVLTMLEESRLHVNTTTNRRELGKSSGGSDDFETLNEILKSFVIGFNPNTIATDVLGVTASVDLKGECGSIQIDEINLDYKKSGSSLTYAVEALGLDIKCQFFVSWDLGVLDVSDELKVRFALKDNNFEIAVTLKGSPPTSATFHGCDAEINVASISSQGGFSSDILNELSDLIIEIVNNEAEVVADVLCEQVFTFTDTVNGLLESLGTTLAPYLTQVQPVDPLLLEKNLRTDVKLVDFTDSDIGFVIQVLIDNLQGNIGAFQINTLIELNILNDDGGFEIIVGEFGGRQLQDSTEITEECGFFRRNLKESNPIEDLTRKLQEVVQTEIGEVLKPILPKALERELQGLIDFPTENLFRLNQIEDLTIEIVGLNTFQETQYLEIIGKQTFRTVLELEGLGVRANFILDASINGVPIREDIQVVLHINGVLVTASYFIGLNREDFEDLSLGRLIQDGAANALPCILSLLEVVGVSELAITVEEIETPVVKGVLDTGVDDLINTAVEAVFCTYQDLILTAIPNVAQNNITVILNDFLECYVRTAADAAECPEGPESIILGSGFFDDDSGGGTSLFGMTEGASQGQQSFDMSSSIGDSSFGGMTFSFGGGEVTELNPASGLGGGTAIVGAERGTFSSSGSNTNLLTEKAGSFVASDPSAIQSAAASAGADGHLNGFIDFRDLLLPPDEALRLGASGKQPYGNLIAMAFGMLRDQLMSIDNSTGLPSINANILQPLTSGQSGVAGLLRFPEQLFNISLDTSTIELLQSLLQRIDIRVSDARIDNLDTVVSPFSFFQPTNQAHVLENILNFGPVSGRPVNMSIRLNFDVEGIDSPIAMSNDIDINAMATELDVFTNIRTLIPIRQFLNFPLSDILNFNCWLSLFQPDLMDMDGGDKIEHAIAIRDFLMKIVSMTVNVKCLNCTSTSLPEVIGLFQQVGATELLGNRAGLLLEDVLTSEFAPSFLTKFLRLGEGAARLCPHSPLYNSTNNRTEELSMILPDLSKRSIDTIVFASILGAEVIVVLASESVLRNGIKESKREGQTIKTDPSSEEERSMLDWTRLNETFVPFAGDLLRMVRGYLGAQADGSESLGVNQLLGDLLGSEGSWNLELANTKFEFAGIAIDLHAIGVAGLDSFKKFDVFEPIMPRTLRNSVLLDTLSFAIDFSVNATSNTDPPQTYTISADLEDVNATILIHTSIDLGKVESLEFGSLIWIENILPCFLSASSDIHIPSMEVTVGSVSNPSIQGLQYETNKVVSDTINSVFNSFGSDIIGAVNMVFNTTLRDLLNTYLDSYVGNATCPTPIVPNSNGASGVFLDFRDLLLSSENALSLGGSGNQPYGDLFPMLFSMLQNSMKSEGNGLLEVNSVFIDPLTESQSGKKGFLRFKHEIFTLAMSFLPPDTLTWLKEQFTMSMSDARLDNLNTLVAPLSILQPSHRAYVLENMLNLGPVPYHSLNATLGFSVELNGSLPLLDMHNYFDFSASVEEINLFADLRFMVAQDRLLKFPLGDVLKMNCWLSLIGMPSSSGSMKASQGIEIKTLLINLMSLSFDLNCLNCTNTILPDLVDVLDKAGVSQVLGNRLGPLLQEIATSPLMPGLIEGFITVGNEAAKLCPHDPLYGQNQLISSTANLPTLLPPLSDLTLDTFLFAAVIAAEAGVVLIADSHNQAIVQETKTIATQNELVIPDRANLLDWTALNATQVPFIPQLLDFIHSSVNGGAKDPAINSLLRGILGKDGEVELPLGGLSFEQMGLKLSFHHLKVQGLTSFSKFEIMNPTSPQTISNDINMEELTIGLNISIDVLETTEPAKHVNFSIKFEHVNISLPIYVAIDEERLGSITVGSLLHSSNILPCLLSTAYGFRVQEMIVSVGSVFGPFVKGFLPDSAGAISSSVESLLDTFGDTIAESLPQLFNETAKAIANGFLSNIETTECKQYPTDNASTFVDFREVFAVYNQSDPSPYGDFIPLIKGLIERELLSVNPTTQMPKINDVIIAPVTRAQSGIVGSLTMKEEFLSYSFGGLRHVGLDEVTYKVLDAKMENLDTLVAPLKIMDPNITSGVLLDNQAKFGTEQRPLRFGIKSNLSLAGKAANSSDEIEVFGELYGAPFFAVLLARIGSEELLTFPLRYVTDFHCWIATLAAPTMKAIGQGQTEVDSALAIQYVELLFSTIHIGATCFDCTNPGLAALPALLEIIDTSGAKDVLGRRTLEFGMEVLESDFSQVWILRFLQDSVRNCPRTKDMKENNIVIANPPLPTVSLDWLETAAFAALVVAQSGAVVMAKTLSVLQFDMKPIFKNPEPDYPPETRLVDFTALDTYPVGGLVNYFIAGANSYLGGTSIDPETGETTLGINELLGDNPVLPLDSYTMEFEDLTFTFSTFMASLKSITITGLDTFTKFRVFDIIGPNQLMNELGWKMLHLELNLEVKAAQQGEGSVQDDKKLAFTIELEAANVATSLQLMLALDYELVKNLQLGSLLRMAHILPCMQATIRHLEILDVDMNIGKIEMRVSGFKSQETRKAAASFERLLQSEFGDSLAEAAPTLFGTAVKPLLNTAINTYLRKSDFKCNEFPFNKNNSGFIDFRDLFLSPNQSKRFGGSGQAQYGDLLRTAYGILQLQLLSADPENGLEMLNPILGTVSFPGVLLNQGMRFNFRGINADITFRVSDLAIHNLDSIGRPLSILAPIRDKAHQLNNTGTFGIGKRPLNIGARIYMHIKGLSTEAIVNDFDLGLDIYSATLVLTALLKVSEMAFVRFPLRDMLNVNCWLALIPPPSLDDHGFRQHGSEPTAAVTAMDITAAKMGLNLDCRNCSSPALYELSELLELPASKEEMTSLVNQLLDSLAGKLGGAFLQDQINRILVDAPRHCGHTDVYDPEATPTAYKNFDPQTQVASATYVPMLIVISLPFVLSAILAFLVRQLVLRRNKKWLKVLPSEQVFLIQQKQEKQDREEAAINAISSSMYCSKEIPFALRQLVPIIILANIGFFLSGHLNKGGRILVEFVVAGEKFIIDDFFTFSIGQSTVDMWHAGGKELALLILLFSGVWPYTKQLVTLALWFLPPAVVSCPRRESFLLWLDILAKWSMIDIFVMLITVAGFRVSIQSPSFAFIPKDLYSIDLFVVPMWGLYANMIAQLISQISSHFIVHYHRRIIESAKEEYNRRLQIESDSSSPSRGISANAMAVPLPAEEEPRARLCQHSYARQHRVASEKLTVRRFINPVMLMGSITVCLLLAISCDIPSMRLEALGLVALMVELGQGLKQAVRYESVFSMASLLVEQAVFLGGFKNYVGLGTVSGLFVITVMVVPITLIVTLLYHWFAPLTAKRRHRVAVFLEILQAWQYVEVYILAIVIESWQLGSISQLMLNRFCSSLEFTMNLLVYYGILDPRDAQCFALEASIMAGAYLFVPLVCCLALLNAFVTKAYVQHLREKQDEVDLPTEDDKLRAFDRTTWDSRREATRNIKSPDVLFTDTFRWLLQRDLQARSSDLWRKKSSATQPQHAMEFETMALAKTSCTDEEHGGEASSRVISLKSSTAESTTEDLESLKSAEVDIAVVDTRSLTSIPVQVAHPTEDVKSTTSAEAQGPTEDVESTEAKDPTQDAKCLKPAEVESPSEDAGLISCGEVEKSAAAEDSEFLQCAAVESPAKDMGAFESTKAHSPSEDVVDLVQEGIESFGPGEVHSSIGSVESFERAELQCATADLKSFKSTGVQRVTQELENHSNNTDEVLALLQLIAETGAT